jgi:hypothetical protein
VIPRAPLDDLVRLKLFVIEIRDFNATLVPAELANTSELNPEQRETLWARVPAHIAARMSAREPGRDRVRVHSHGYQQISCRPPDRLRSSPLMPALLLGLRDCRIRICDKSN